MESYILVVMSVPVKMSDFEIVFCIQGDFSLTLPPPGSFVHRSEFLPYNKVTPNVSKVKK